MKRKIKIALILIILFILYIYIANITLFPKNILLMQGEKINLATMWGISLNNNIENKNDEKTMQASSVATDTTNQVGKLDLNLNLFQIPVSQVSVHVIQKTKVIPLRRCNRFKVIYRGGTGSWNDSNRRSKTI